jgi:C4-dicarboxylate-specific signal transduction histidine kinase
MIQDPANRISVTTLKLKEAKQSGDQSVRDFANFLDELEEDIPEMSHEEQRAWSLLNGLRREVRSGVLREEREIRSQEQVITAAQRLHELGTMSTGVSHAFHTGDRSQDGEAQASRGAESKEKSTLEGRTETRKCHRCYQRGYIIVNCPEAEAEMKRAV